ncbi:MAG TPA: hypothetical protein VNU72_04200, partial [Puia sp.]|nr:hypothetical protein [Puia sp.]
AEGTQRKRGSDWEEARGKREEPRAVKVVYQEQPFYVVFFGKKGGAGEDETAFFIVRTGILQGPAIQ